jgi:hypothetical protein
VRGNPKPAAVITWNRLEGATGYTVYRSTTEGGTYTQVGAVTVSDPYQYSYAYTDTGVSANTTYYYKVSAGNGNGEGVKSPPVSDTTPAVETGTGLTHNTWAEGNISSPGEVHWYTFTPAAAGAYTLQWDDLYNSPGGKTAYLYVSAYRASDGTPVFTNAIYGYTTPQAIDVSSDETIYVRVECSDSNYGTGTYAIRYYQGITGGEEYPFILSSNGNTLTVNIMNRGNGVTGWLPTDSECDTWALQNDINKGTFPIGKWVGGSGGTEYILFTATAITAHSPWFPDSTGIYSIDSGTGILSVLWSYY